VRARASTTSSATRREVEQSIARFEKRLDDANDALQTLGKHLGRGAQSSYKEVTAALRALRRDAAKTNKAALKDFDKLREALTQARASASRSTASKSRSNSGAARTGSRTTSRSTTSRSTASRSTTSRSGTGRSSASRSSGGRSSSGRAKKS
jgi:ATP/maltotriose-dependent transcriptional regulator MalT